MKCTVVTLLTSQPDISVPVEELLDSDLLANTKLISVTLLTSQHFIFPYVSIALS